MRKTFDEFFGGLLVRVGKLEMQRSDASIYLRQFYNISDLEY